MSWWESTLWATATSNGNLEKNGTQRMKERGGLQKEHGLLLEQTNFETSLDQMKRRSIT